MINTITLRIKVLLSLFSFFIVFNSLAQTGKLKIEKPNNSFGISNATWNVYLNKTNLLLENVDVNSFLNYVAVSAHENISETPYFRKYVQAKLKKDKEELINKVGTGLITSVPEVKNYLSSLQPAYSTYFVEYMKHRAEIIESQKKLKAHNGGPPTPFNCGSPCTNPGFESGTGFWDYFSGTADASGTMTGITSGFNSSAHVLETVGGYDPVVGGTSLPLVSPSGGNNSMMLGNGPVTGYGASRASISFDVSATNANFTYQFAVILQDPVSGHTDPERPYFDVQVKDAGGNLVNCGEYHVMAKPPMPGFLSTSDPDVYYRPWTTVFVPLQAYIGQCVTIEFTASDCAQGGHYGYAYIDADCGALAMPSSSPAVCAGADVTLTAPAGGVQYDWSNTSAGGTTGIVGATNGQTVVINQAGTYQVIVTAVTGPTCTTTLTITVPSSPNNPVPMFSNTTVCAGTPTQFTDLSTPADSITAWSWDFNNDGVPDSTTQNPSFIFPGAGTYPVTLVITWGPCNASFVQNVTVTPGGTPIISPVASLCSNAAPFNLTVNTSGGTWSGTGITNTTNGTFDPGQASISSTNVISYTTTGTCADSDTIHINVIQSDTATWTTTSLCSNATPVNLDLLVTGTPGGTWSGNGVTGNMFNPSGLNGAIPVTYTVGSSPCGATSTQNINVTIIADATITPVSPMCSNAAPITLTAANTGGTWSGSGITNTSTGTFNPASAGSGINNVITYSIPGTCGATDTIQIYIIPGSTATWTTTALCSDDTPVNLNSLVTGTPGGTWSGTGVTGSTFNPAGLNGAIPVTYTVGTTPCVATSTQNITVTPRADATINAVSTLCSNAAPITLTAANTGGTWSGTGITNTSTGTFNPLSANSGTNIITYTIGGTCGDIDTVHVNVVPSSNPNWTNPSLCSNATPLDLNTLVTGTSGGTWSGNGVSGSTFNPAGLSGNTNITYTVGQAPCQSSSTLPVNVTLVNASFNANPTTGIAPLNVDFTNTSSPGFYNWTFGNGDVSSYTNDSTTYLEPGYYNVLLITTNNGCVDSAMMTIHVEQLSILTLPNVFTPNGDNNNEEWHAIIAEGLTSFKATVYDRWGLKMYEWTDEHAGWNGKAKNGSPAPDGTYYYIVTAKGDDGKDFDYTGFIQLIRAK